MHSIKEGITWKHAIRSSRAIIQTMQNSNASTCSKQLVINHKIVINSHNTNKELWLHTSIEVENHSSPSLNIHRCSQSMYYLSRTFTN